MNNPARPNADPAKLVGEWQVGIRAIHFAHTRAAADYTMWGRILGLGVAITTAVTGSVVFASAGESDNRFVLSVVAGFIILAAVIGAIHTTLQLPARAAEHSAAAKEYGVLRKEFETKLLCGDPADLCRTLDEIRTKWTEIEGKYPFVSHKRYWGAHKHVLDSIERSRRAQEKPRDS